MSQSPSEAVALDANSVYLAGWRQLSTLIAQGHSFSGRERHVSFLNLNGTRFADISAASGFALPDDGRGLALTDWDHDGDLDLWITNRTPPAVRFLQNRLPPGANDWVALKLEGKTCNRDAVGARVQIQVGGGDAPILLSRTFTAGSGFLSQNTRWLHFGLGNLRGKSLAVSVRWPGTATWAPVSGIEPGTRFRIVQGEETAQRADLERQVSLADKITTPLPPTTQARIPLTNPLPLTPLAYLDFQGNHHAEPRPFPSLTLVNLWSPSCQACLTEFEEWRSYSSGNKDEWPFRIVALCIDQQVLTSGEMSPDRLAAAKTFAKNLPPAIIAGIASPETVQAIANVRDRAFFPNFSELPLPTSLLVDPQGRVRFLYHGATPIEQVIEDAELIGSDDHERILASLFPFGGLTAIGLLPIDGLGFGRAYYEGHYDDDARRELTAYVSDQGTHPSQGGDSRKTESLAEAYFLLSRIERRSGDAAKAVEFIEKALEHAPAHRQLKRELAIALAARYHELQGQAADAGVNAEHATMERLRQRVRTLAAELNDPSLKALMERQE